MRVILWFCYIHLFLALGIWCFELFNMILEGNYRFISTGELWASIDKNSLVGLQALIENNTWYWLWWKIIFPLLTLPAWVIPLILGLCALIINLVSKILQKK